MLIENFRVEQNRLWEIGFEIKTDGSINPKMHLLKQLKF
jgi:hypothetical protein